VEAPGLGDDIQAIKAGILEIADILVVNKADRPGVENTEKALKSMLDLAHPVQRAYMHHGRAIVVDAPGSAKGDADMKTEGWIPPIRKTVATEGIGIAELVEQIAKHAEFLRLSGDWELREQARLESEMDMILQQRLMSQFREHVTETHYDEVMRRVFEKSLSPWEAVKMLTNGKSAGAAASGPEGDRD
jgi:LAO/AO transport system kinase